MKIQNLLIKDMILPDLKSEDRTGILTEMVSYLKKKNKISKEKDLFDRLLQRESLAVLPLEMVWPSLTAR